MIRVTKTIQEILAAYFRQLDMKLPDLVKSYYLTGSTALGDYCHGVSDIDFVAVVQRKVDTSELAQLIEIHHTMKRKFPEADLMGLYIPSTDLLSLAVGENNCACFVNGKFEGYKQFRKNSIEAYQLRKYGILIRGENISFDDCDMDWDAIFPSLIEEINDYWIPWKIRGERLLALRLYYDLAAIEWGVLSMSRIYCDFRERDLTSKTGAGEYALKTLPQKWHKIINESLRLRKGVKRSYYKSVYSRKKDLTDYLDFTIQECKRLYQEEND